VFFAESMRRDSTTFLLFWYVIDEIIDPKKVDYTFTEHSFNMKSSHMTMKKILAYQVNQKQKEKISID
jgi:hypothetical protein